MPTRVAVDDDEQQIQDLIKEMRRLRSRLATTAVKGSHDEFTAAATPSTTYTLTYIPLTGTCLMALNGHVQREGTDYTCDYSTGIVTVSATQASGDQITFRYLVTDWLIARSLAPEQGLSLFSVGGFLGNHTYGYNIDNATWDAAATHPDWPAPANTHDLAIGSINGKIYAAGGSGGSGDQSAIYVFDPTGNSWSTLTAMPAGVSSCGYAVLNSKLYVIGGGVATVRVYDPSNDTWSTAASLPTATSSPICGVVNGKIYAAGGTNSTSSDPVPTCYEYDPVGNTWTTKASMGTKTSWAAGAGVGSKFYVVGGTSKLLGGVILLNTLQIYDPSNNTWTTGANWPQTADHLAACEAGGKLYTTGGTTTNASGGATKKLYVYDPAFNSWTTLADMANAQYGHALASTASA